MGKWVTQPYAEHQGPLVFGEEFKNRKIPTSLVRETIQNSLDHKRESANNVVVEFDYKKIAVNQVPDAIKLVKNISLAIKKSMSPQEGLFLQRALDVVKTQTNEIGVLRISDHGTIGLCGIKDDTAGSPWRRLVMTMGAGNADANRGGSFGVGKKVPFLASSFRTVFYSTLTEENDYAGHVGVTHMASFLDPDHDNRCVSEKWLYCDEGYDIVKQQGKPAIAGQSKFYTRQAGDYGTDVIILGFDNADSLVATIVKVVLKEFMVSLFEGKLEVKLPNGETVNKESLEHFVETTKDKTIRNVYELVKSPWVDSEEISFGQSPSDRYPAGAFKYKLIRKDEASDCYITREKGMIVHNEKKLTDLVGYLGLVMICDKSANQDFRAMENARHDEFEITQARFNYDAGAYERARRQKDALIGYLKKKAEALAGDVGDVVAAELTDELENLFDQELAGAITGAENVNIKAATHKIAKVFVKRQKHKKEKIGKATPTHIDDNPNGGAKRGQIQLENKGGTRSKKPNPSGLTVENPNDPAKNGFVLRELPSDAFSFCATGASASGRYAYDLKVQNDCDRIGLCFSAQNESTTKSSITIRKCIKGLNVTRNEEILGELSSDGKAVYFSGVSAGDNLSVEVEFDVDCYIYAEVRYYEKKNG